MSMCFQIQGLTFNNRTLYHPKQGLAFYGLRSD